MTRSAVTIVAASLTAATLAGSSPATAVQPLGCLIEPHQVAEVGSPVIGVIEAIRVERGDRVRRGQPLAELRADVERAQLQVAHSRAQASAEVKAAEANASLARQKLARSEDLLARQFISRQALDQAVAEARVADERVSQAREQKRTAEREYELAAAQVGMRVIRAPADGVIADRYLSVGERVEEKPVFRVATIDPLRVEVVLPAALFGAVAPGSSLAVTPEFPNAEAREARVSVVDKLIDGASNTFRVRLTLPNPDMRLPAGLRCRVAIAGATGTPATQPPQDGMRKANADGRARFGVAPAVPAPPAATLPGMPALRLDTKLPVLAARPRS